MAGLCEGGNEPPGSLKAKTGCLHITRRLTMHKGGMTASQHNSGPLIRPTRRATPIAGERSQRRGNVDQPLRGRHDHRASARISPLGPCRIPVRCLCLAKQ
ncbi:hypothetical protein ANN_24186 [Periplaneta americana]|uniref:Uncharacterized protein n=1 Tax=Periplaneta americana TaxID=6978 RepID=A0ABQ8S2E3_PERAM|nr:hypothetical protein ANN_24186 [Periplaneta americana]